MIEPGGAAVGGVPSIDGRVSAVDCAPDLLHLLRSVHLDSCAGRLRQLGVANIQDLQVLDLSSEHTIGILKLKKLELKRLARLLSRF